MRPTNRSISTWYGRGACLMGASEVRISRSVLREAGGEIPPAYSPLGDPAQSSFDWSRETSEGGQEGRVSDNAFAVAIAVPRPDWRSVAFLAVDFVSSAHSKRAYQKALKDFLAWHSSEARPPLSRAIVQQYRTVLESALDSLFSSGFLALSTGSSKFSNRRRAATLLHYGHPIGC